MGPEQPLRPVHLLSRALGTRRLASLARAPGRALLAVGVFVLYVGSIALANWMISHVGRSVPGAHVLPVWPGLDAPSGVYVAASTFIARDLLQRLAGTGAGLAAILVGAVASWAVSTPTLALASAGTFLLSESCDFLVYTPLQGRHFPLAVLGSGLVSDVVDSTVFLSLAGIPLATALPGQLVGKAWVVLAGGLVAGLLRRTAPFAQPAPAPAMATLPGS